MKQGSMRVVMGSSAIKAFVAAPKSLKILGIVRMGLEFGLLCQDDAGHYLRVNGSQIEKLNRAEVLDAIQYAIDSGRQSPHTIPLSSPILAKPVIAFRKRRHVLAANTADHALQAA